MPFQSGDGSIPPVLTMSARPVSGASTSLLTQNLSAGTVFSFQGLGFATIPGGLPLAPFGMPGCTLYINPLAATLVPVVGGTATYNLPIPGHSSFLGVNLQAQSFPLTAGLNSAGIISSNALCLQINNL